MRSNNRRAVVATIRLELVVVIVVDPEYPQGQVLHHPMEEPNPSALCQVEAVLRSLLVLPPGRHLVLGHGPGHHSLRVSDAAPGSATLRLEPGDMGVSVLLVEAVDEGVDLINLVDVVYVPGGRVRPIPLEPGQFGGLMSLQSLKVLVGLFEITSSFQAWKGFIKAVGVFLAMSFNPRLMIRSVGPLFGP